MVTWRVMHVTFHDNVLSGLNLSFATWAAGGEVWEESLSVFTDGGVSSSHTVRRMESSNYSGDK